MGIFKAKEPSSPKVSIRPAIMIVPSTYLINQTEPNPSFHPLFEGLQHALRPNRTFHPSPSLGSGLSHLLSLLRHCRRLLLAQPELHSSTFLHPFAPSRFRDFFALMGALTPVLRVLRVHSCDNERPPWSGQVSLLHMTQPSMHSVTKHLAHPAIASPLPAQRGRLLGLLSRSGLRLESAGSSLRTAESCSLSYGLHVRLRLLSTPPRGDAVTFGYQERASPEKDFHLYGRACLQAHGFLLPQE
jgi:hypothetical protein